MTRPPAHNYNWALMEFDPSKPIDRAFRKDCTPEDPRWWFENMDTKEGHDRFEEMKRLYAADQANRSWFRRRITDGSDMTTSANHMTGPED